MSSRASWLVRIITPTILVLLAGAAAQTPAPNPPATPGAATPTQQQPGPQGASGNNSQPAAQQPQPAQEPMVGEPSSDQSGMFVFKKQVEEVVLHATVVDDQQRLVTGLDRSAFTVFQHGVPQTVTSFRREDVPVEIGIVVDNSGSMRDKRAKVTDAVLNLIRTSNPRDQVFVVNFGAESYLDQDFTSDVNLLQAALHQVSARGSTALYDAIVASAVHLRNNPRLEKKVLLVITDGQDNMSQETLREAERRLQQPNGPTLYAIGLLGIQGRGRDALQSLAAGTGGVAYFPETLDEVNNVTRNIAHDIRSQYIIAYKPQNQNAKPGFESIRVEAQAPGFGPLTVRTRTGYYPPESTH
jgi:Ca-activated chloride channel homolog